MNYYTECLKKYFDFEGRATQEEFWYFFIINIIIISIIVFIEETFDVLLYSSLFTLALLIPTFSAAVRRLHDVGHSGWRLLLLIIPFIGLIIILVILGQRSKKENVYGTSLNDTENHDFTPLMQSATKGDLEQVKELIDSGADLNIKDSKGKTALMYAMEKGYLQVVEELIRSGAK